LSLVKIGKGRKKSYVLSSHPSHWGIGLVQRILRIQTKHSIWITHIIGSVLSPLPIQRSKNLHKEASVDSPDKNRWMSIVKFQ